jgi:hypothetical protein
MCSQIRIGRLCVLLFLVLFVAGHAPAGDKNSSKALIKDEVVAGSPADFMEVRHIVLRGTNEAIGQSLAELARDRFSAQPMPSSDPFRTRVQRRYIEKNYPILFDRMKGVAASFGKSLDDDSLNFNGLWFPSPPPGCSVIYFPPGVTADGTGIVSRDYDFTTGTLRFTRPKPGELPCTARPYVVEMHPVKGYASIALCAYDMLSGVMDGMNSEGLTVALLADDELYSKYRMEPTGDTGVGLGCLQMQRYLLDNCANVEEAKIVLLITKQHYELISVHYLIADRHGKSFVWEYSQAHNREYIIENEGKPLITTNFSLHRYLEGNAPPSIAKAKSVCPRYCTLTQKLAANSDKVTPEFIKQTHKLVDATQPAVAGSSRPPNRTLWHALYFPEKRKMQISFYLKDEPDPNQSGKTRIVRSNYLDFELANAPVTRR